MRLLDYRKSCYSKLENGPDTVTCEAVFDRFQDTLLSVPEMQGTEHLAQIDAGISAYSEHANNPYITDSVFFRHLRPRQFESYEIASYQYFQGLDSATYGVGCSSVFHDFLTLMESVLQHCDTHLLPQIRHGLRLPQGDQVRSMLKVWRYTSLPNNRYLIPIHFDRSLVTSVIHSRNPGEERLLVGGHDDGTPVEQLAERFLDSRPFRPSKSDFPISFPGLSAAESYNIPATAHGVEQVEEQYIGSHRFSLVYFVLPPAGLTVTRDYVAPEKHAP
jgi:hypothetical protein